MYPCSYSSISAVIFSHLVVFVPSWGSSLSWKSTTLHFVIFLLLYTRLYILSPCPVILSMFYCFLCLTNQIIDCILCLTNQIIDCFFCLADQIIILFICIDLFLSSQLLWIVSLSNTLHSSHVPFVLIPPLPHSLLGTLSSLKNDEFRVITCLGLTLESVIIVPFVTVYGLGSYAGCNFHFRSLRTRTRSPSLRLECCF